MGPRIRQSACCGALLAATLAAPLLASDHSLDQKHYLSGLLLYIEPDEDRGIKHGLGGRYIYGYHLSEKWVLELGGFSAVIETGGDLSDEYAYGIGPDLMYRFDPWGSVTPFALVGGGMSYNDIQFQGGDDTSGYANAGVGVLSRTLGRWNARLRAEVRWVGDRFSDDYNDTHVGIGLLFPLGQPAPQREVVEVERPRVDTDGDTVVDELDRCPGTPAGARVDSDGCVIGSQVIIASNINFETASATLLSYSESALDQLAAGLKGQRNLRLDVRGHTDSRGDDDYNLQLSQDRAQSVVDYLVRAGVSPDQLSAHGFGETQPLASNDNPESRAMNRRVEFAFSVVGDSGEDGKEVGQ